MATMARRPASKRKYAGDRLPAVPPVNLKVGIGRQEHRIIQRLGHADQAGIREADRHVRVLVHQLEDSFDIFVELKSAKDRAATNDRRETRSSRRPEQMDAFRQHCLACCPRWRRSLRLRRGPRVIGVPPAKERNKEARINENGPDHIVLT